MSDDQFTRLFKYIEKRFDKVDEQFAANARDHADIRSSIAEISVSGKDYREEMIISNYRME
jgi:hypothetical protein